MTKTELRKSLIKQRQSLPQSEMDKSSRVISNNLIDFFCQTTRTTPPTSIAGYLATRHEVSLDDFFQYAWQHQWSCYLPIISQETTLSFGSYHKESLLETNQYGISEPSHTEQSISLSHLNYVLLPAVALDRQGHRLGMGKGYYDRTFANMNMKEIAPQQRPILIGIGYDFQLLDQIPTTTNDVSMDFIVTETEFLCFNFIGS